MQFLAPLTPNSVIIRLPKPSATSPRSHRPRRRGKTKRVTQHFLEMERRRLYAPEKPAPAHCHRKKLPRMKWLPPHPDSHLLKLPDRVVLTPPDGKDIGVFEKDWRTPSTTELAAKIKEDYKEEPKDDEPQMIKFEVLSNNK